MQEVGPALVLSLVTPVLIDVKQERETPQSLSFSITLESDISPYCIIAFGLFLSLCLEVL